MVARILEFLGDGILAILNENGERSAREACQLAFEGAREGLDGLSALNHDLSITPRHLKAGFALHYGEVSYGNIGAGDRLDFTVIAPDVNLTSRIERLCRELDRNLIMSEDFVRYLNSPLSEIGCFRLRGFSRMQLLSGCRPPDWGWSDELRRRHQRVFRLVPCSVAYLDAARKGWRDPGILGFGGV